MTPGTVATGLFMKAGFPENGGIRRHIGMLAALCFVFLLSGCATHYITRDMLLEQLRDAASLRMRASGTGPIFGFEVFYRANRISEVYCINDKGEKVFLAVDKNSMLIVHDKQGQNTKFYLDTVYFEDEKIKGLRSRLLRMPREVNLADIDIIEVYSEFAREREAPQ